MLVKKDSDDVVKLKKLFNYAFTYTSLYETASQNYIQSQINARDTISNHSKKLKITNAINNFSDQADDLYHDQYIIDVNEIMKNEVLKAYGRYTLMIYTKTLATRTNMAALNFNNFFLKKNNFVT